MLRLISILLVMATVFNVAQDKKKKKPKLNVATPDEHPYVAPKGNRDNHRLSGEKVNEFRVYDFYQRQAEYYLKQGKKEGVVPAYPGLDAGLHGHWGKHNQNSHRDDRWNKVIDDGIVGTHTIFPKQAKMKSLESSIVLTFGSKKDSLAVFSPREFNFTFFTSGGALKYDSFRWGTSRGATLSGKSFLKAGSSKTGDCKYHGYYKNGDQYIFSYRLNGTEILDSLTAVTGKFNRQIQLDSDAENLTLKISSDVKEKKGKGSFLLKNGALITLMSSAKFSPKLEGDQLSVVLEKAGKGTSLNCLISLDGTAWSTAGTDDLSAKLKGGKASLADQSYTTAGQKGKDNKAYVIDDIFLPFENKTNSLMFFTGIDFNAKGEAFISSLKGDIWKVTGLDKDLNSVKWTKIASGLNQPFGLRIRDGVIYVLERTKITGLHDKNGDGEIDFFECINNEIQERARSHSHKFGLEIDQEGSFYFAADVLVQKVDGKTRKLETLAKGVRNCMGIGMMKDGSFIVGPQEGTNTPTSSLFKIYKDDDYGFKSNPKVPSSPMAYIPRGVDASTGGFYQMDDSRWGPLGMSFIGLSYGYGQWYQILTDSTGKRQQAATVPMEGQFLSGVVRAAKNPVDGQLYTVGLDGWGDYSVNDGCFHRIRFTGQKLYKPIGYKTYFNGLRIDFAEKLDIATANSTGNFFAQQWDYVNSRQYGSPEYSVSEPGKLGHDLLTVHSVRVLEGGKSIFVEIPKLQPVMQMHLHMHLKAADGTPFKTDLFPTILELGGFNSFKGAQPKDYNKPVSFELRTKKETKTSLITESGKKDAHARKITVITKNLQYDLKTIRVKAGESIALILKNDDAMPHNLVIVDPGAHQKVGEASFKMLNNPKAAEMHYVPEMKEVVAFTNVIQAKGTHTLYMEVPKTKGTYTFFCSFPGHWMLMKGDFIVE